MFMKAAKLAILTVAPLLAMPSAPRAAESARPNILFILADDLGWRDLGCYGSTYHRTPNLDRLASRGLRFTQAYAANPLCSPTRSSILTGLWPARTGITAPSCHLPRVVLDKHLVNGNPNARVLVAESLTRLKTDYVTLPKVLRDAGYRTGHFGKWHLGAEPYSALQHGFDVDWPHWPGPGPAGSYVAPWKFPPKLGVEGKPGEHIEDTLSSHVVDFIRENKDRPFYANYWAFSVHAPYDAKDELVSKYRGLADPKNPQRNPVYAAMVESLDDGVGRVFAALDECGIAEKTIVVFFSDNGGVSWAGTGGTSEHKSARFQADMKSPPTSNLPLRNGKASLYEGGVREPCIVVWPGVTKAGTVNDAIIQSIDWMPTLLGMAGVPLPEGAKPDGISIVPAIKGGTLQREAVFTHFPHDTPASGQHPGTSVRRGDWKLIRLFAGNDDGSDKLELFNLKDDLGETKDLAAEKPQLARELNALIDGFLKDTDAVIPKLNPAFKPKPDAAATQSRIPQPGAGQLVSWTVSKDARISIADHELRIVSVGGDPWFFTRDLPIGAKGPFTLELSMRSDAKGDGQVFFTLNPKDPFARSPSVTFKPVHDGAFHDYALKLDAPGGIHALRIDPARAAGRIAIRSLVLRDARGEIAKNWTFDAQASAVPGRSKFGRAPVAPPNVLFILTEDQGAHLGRLGTPGLRTPHMDALARDGVCFRQFYVNYPVCSPSKACVYTGLYPHRNGLINNTQNFFKSASEITEAEGKNVAYAKNQIKPGVRTLAEILHGRGYYMGVSGKLHVSPNEKFPYDEFIRGKDVVGGFVERTKAAGKPWFLFDNALAEPHRPYVNSDERTIAVEPAEVRLPAFLPDTPECRKDWAEYLNGIQLADTGVGRALADLKSSGEFDRTLVIVMAGDHGPAFQHGKMTPYELGLHVNLIVRAPGGARDLTTDALASEVDLFPTILDYLNVPTPSPVDGISLRPIIEGKPGAKGHAHVFAEVSGRPPGGRRGMEERSVLDGRWHLITRTRLDEPRMIQADSRDFDVWRNRTYRETVRSKDRFPEAYRILSEFDPDQLGGKPPAFELYDLQTDRDEMHSLANAPAHRGELERLFAALQTWSAETRDTAAPLPTNPPE